MTRDQAITELHKYLKADPCAVLRALEGEADMRAVREMRVVRVDPRAMNEENR